MCSEDASVNLMKSMPIIGMLSRKSILGKGRQNSLYNPSSLEELWRGRLLHESLIRNTAFRHSVQQIVNRSAPSFCFACDTFNKMKATREMLDLFKRWHIVDNILPFLLFEYKQRALEVICCVLATSFANYRLRQLQNFK
jgi:hypothetical protein